MQFYGFDPDPYPNWIRILFIIGSGIRIQSSMQQVQHSAKNEELES
jgi:hypothetical protein